MINVKIYCSKKHKDYDTAYQAVVQALAKFGEDFTIERIYKKDIIRRKYITQEPHIVINNQVIYAGEPPKEENILLILKKMILPK